MSSRDCRYRSVVKQDLRVATPPLTPTPAGWIDVVLKDFDEFLKDHASCEKKASGMALSVAAHYPDQPKLLLAMVDLAVEELNHYREVVRLLLERDLQPGPDVKDGYVNSLNQLIRKGPEYFMLDRLLVAAAVERRGAERFSILAAHLHEPELRKFYTAIAESEARHWTMFLGLAGDHFEDQVGERWRELCAAESALMLGLKLKPALH
jgi:tRNA-(ms[2]io[6]A)-hydroxylase